MTNSIEETQRLGQSIWYDNIRRSLLTSGELERLIGLGVTGVTSNPTIFEKAIAGSTDYDEPLMALARSGTSVAEMYEALAVEDIRAAADLLRPVYDRTAGADGYVSLEVSPTLAHDTAKTVADSLRLFAALDRPNTMIKVPATREGIPAIRSLIGRGINVNVTLIFSLEAYQGVMEAYIGGLEELVASGGEVSRVASVASFFVSRVDTAVDALLEEHIRGGQSGLETLLGKAAVANAKLAYQAFQGAFGVGRFAALRDRGARVQRPLWASTGTKNPAYSDVLYLESLIGPETVNTVPPQTLTAFLKHGRAEATLGQDIVAAQETMASLERAGISVEGVTSTLLAEGVASFAGSFDKLLANVGEKQARLLARDHSHAEVSLGELLPDVEATLAGLQAREVMERIWRRDHTVWRPDPKEIADRLGWLTVTDQMVEQLPALEAFAVEVRDAGFRHVVLLGMGGSSLGPEVLRQTFGNAPSYPELIVLDSTVPAWVQAVTETVDPARSLFLVSSKSGGTLEPNILYRHFRALVESVVGKERAGGHFVAITDGGTPLERLAQEEGFRRIFLNPADIGGRYSVLSYFGLVPAALAGMDVGTLLDRADCMREGCASFLLAHEDPGAWLGATLATLAWKGRDKLTIVPSPAIGGFGLWVEQLIAESTGKEGKGIVPVAGEPLVDPIYYGEDRLFVYLRLEGDNNARTDVSVERIRAAGQPVLQLELRDRHDLGAEFFRWELATAVAGALLGIHPFDQPSVQAAKDETDRVLAEHRDSGRLPQVESPDSLWQLLDRAEPGDYLAIMVYARPTLELDGALASLRQRVLERHRIATTLGYGPRFLHSTGQLHKGGPDSGLFLQLTEGHKEELSIPGEEYSFSVLADAQALGDLRALQALGRRVARVRLDADPEVSVRQLTDELR